MDYWKYCCIKYLFVLCIFLPFLIFHVFLNRSWQGEDWACNLYFHMTKRKRAYVIVPLELCCPMTKPAQQQENCLCLGLHFHFFLTSATEGENMSPWKTLTVIKDVFVQLPLEPGRLKETQEEPELKASSVKNNIKHTGRRVGSRNKESRNITNSYTAFIFAEIGIQ